MKFHLMNRPDYFEFFSNGGVELDDFLIELLGDVKGLTLLDTCCACDAAQAFSWHNLGAKVIACDITPSAIRIARQNAETMNLQLDFIVDDMQSLATVPDDSFDIVFATYPVWLSDLQTACKTWRRVLKEGGRLLLHAEHPIASCLSADGEKITIQTNYNRHKGDRYDRFTGTPLADRFGGWAVDMPSVENFYRTSDMINAVCGAGLRVLQVLEPDCAEETSLMAYLPSDFVILAKK